MSITCISYYFNGVPLKENIRTEYRAVVTTP